MGYLVPVQEWDFVFSQVIGVGWDKGNEPEILARAALFAAEKQKEDRK